LRVERGTRLVAPPGLASNPQHAVFAVHGNALQALDTYCRQLEARHWRRGPEPRDRDLADLRVNYGVMDASLTLAVTPMTRNAAFMLIALWS
jgi:hypothetical protein